MAFQIKATDAAARQIRKEAHWWRRNRSQAPDLFRDELRRALALIAEYPEAGSMAKEIELAGVRRVVLVDTQHYVYYRVNDIAKRIEILAVWSTKFGGSPPLATT